MLRTALSVPSIQARALKDFTISIHKFLLKVDKMDGFSNFLELFLEKKEIVF